MDKQQSLSKTSKELKEEVFELMWNYYASHQALLEGRI